MKNPFFKNHGPVKLVDILANLNLKNFNDLGNNLVYDVKDLKSAKKK